MRQAMSPQGPCRVALTLISSIIVATAAQAAEPAKTSVRACGLQVVGPGYSDADDHMGLRAFNQFGGTGIARMVENPAGGLIEFDDDASQLAEMKDDKGTDLLKTEQKFGSNGFSPFAQISDDGKAAIVEAKSGGIAAAGATAIHLKGKLAFVSATEKKTYTQKAVALKKGEKITEGPVPMTISEVGKPDFSDNPLMITLKANEELKGLAAIRFLDENGEEIESSAAGSSSMSGFGKVVVEKNYDLSKKVDAVAIELTYWTDMKTIELDVDTKISVGLSP